MSIRVPALRGDDALGFLAAIGLVALSEQGVIPPVRLAWEGVASPGASLSGVATLDQLVHALAEGFAGLVDRGDVLPGVGAQFPVAVPKGQTTDPMRMTPEELAGWYGRADDLWHRGDPWLSRWLIALAAQAAVKDADRRDVELTPFYAPTGRMSVRGSIFDKTMEAVAAVDGPGDALTGWRRTSYDGANFDDRAKRDAAVTTSGKPDNQGAPSPTWLAAMGMRFFPMVDDGHSTRAVGWQRFRMYPGFTNRSLVWPTWRDALGAAAVRALLAHPALQLTGRPGEPAVRDPDTLGALGVTALFGASRRTLSQGDGPLGPARRLWYVAST